MSIAEKSDTARHQDGEQWFGVDHTPVGDGTYFLRLVPPLGTTLEDMQAVPSLPDVSGLSLLNAALAYVACGWFVLPTDPADIKNPGSVVRDAWQDKSSRDPQQIRQWWASNPGYGIALHVGKSGAIGFDFDGDDLGQIARDGYPEIAAALRRADAIQGTRRTGDRCHFLFVMPPGKPLGNGAGVFARWGEVRGVNGVLIAAPTPHPDPGVWRLQPTRHRPTGRPAGCAARVPDPRRPTRRSENAG
jgi:hypothetical protein